MKEIRVQCAGGHYEIYVGERFYCSCENRREVDEELADMKKEQRSAA